MKAFFRKIVLALVVRIAPHIPLSAYQALLPRHPLGFFYHAISDGPLPHVKHLYPFKSSAEFEKDLLWLKKNTALVGYEELKSHFSGERTLPKNAAFISFDDGFRECYDVVRPLLIKHEIPCMFFLTTDWIDNKALFFRSKISLALDALSQLPPDERNSTLQSLASRFDSPKESTAFTRWLKNNKDATATVVDDVCRALDVDTAKFLSDFQPYLTRTQIQVMQDEGFVFGAHSCNHTKFNELSEDEQENQIIKSCKATADITGLSEVPFAFPFSGEGVSRKMLKKLRKNHPEIGLIFDTKKLLREPGVVNRIWVDKPSNNTTPEKNIAHWLLDGYVRLISRNQTHLS